MHQFSFDIDHFIAYFVERKNGLSKTSQRGTFLNFEFLSSQLQNEDLKKQVASISEKFNAYIMRDKEFQDLRREVEFYRQQLEKYKAKNQAHESVSFTVANLFS